MNDFAVMILAAGQSSRLGHPKQLVEIQGETLLLKQCKMALSITKHVYCVLGSNADTFKSHLKPLPINVVENTAWEAGMSSSISCAIPLLPSSTKHVMIILVDQWQLTKSLLIPFTQTLTTHKDKIITSSYSITGNTPANVVDKHASKIANNHNLIGPPTIFPKKYFTALSSLSGEKGAKVLMVNEIKNVIQFPMPEAFVDLDNAHDLSKLRALFPC